LVQGDGVVKIYNKEYDKRSECYLVLATMELSEYMELVKDAFDKKGNLEGQRDVISHSSVANKIRNRMANDFINGSVFPQVVIGLLVDDVSFHLFDKFDPYGSDENIIKIIKLIKNMNKDAISIIDGIQRTNIYFENSIGNEKRPIRVEFYITTSVTKLLYRMLVLNTGQVPWNTRRQLEVIFSNLSTSILNAIQEKNLEIADKININSIDDKQKRKNSGTYNKSTLIEMYLTFNTRNIKVNLSNEIAEEFQRFDMLQSVEKQENFSIFIEVFILLCKWDIVLGTYGLSNTTEECSTDYIDSKFQIEQGIDFFTNIPIVMGFIAACSEYILGAVTVERTPEAKNKKLNIVERQFNFIINKIQADNSIDYMDFDTLNLAISSLSKKGNIGEIQRKYFKDAFTSIIKYDDLEELPTLGACWREQ